MGFMGMCGERQQQVVRPILQHMAFLSGKRCNFGEKIYLILFLFLSIYPFSKVFVLTSGKPYIMYFERIKYYSILKSRDQKGAVMGGNIFVLRSLEPEKLFLTSQ